MPSILRSTLLAACLAIAATHATAGRLHPLLEEKLRTAAPGETFAVIVELKEQWHPEVVLAGMSKAPRKARIKALVAGLRDRAERGQVALKAELAQQHALGAVRRMRPFWIFNGFALTAREPLIRRLAARDDVLEVRVDAEIAPPPRPASAGPATADAEWNIAMIRAPEVWALSPGYDGTGTVVGSFDTGVYGKHEDLSARYRGNNAISWFDPYGEHSEPYDFHGHGTHTTGTAVGGDSGGSHIGVAPGATWIAAKAWRDDGTGFVSAFHQIFEWFLDPDRDPENAPDPPDVVINSWSLVLPGCDREFAPDIQAWRAAGIFPAFAAGNSGPGTASVRSPGAYAESFAVGATDMVDEVASFSSRGPSPCDGTTKPDISAPGVGVRSSTPDGYGTLSGTSMATPHLAGAVAVLRSINPELTVDELADILKLSATDVATPGTDNASGAGRLDLLVAAELAIRGADTPLVKVIASQPIATEAGPTAGTLTFSRTGKTDAALEIKLEVSGTATPGSDYVPLPGSITIPAGAASTTLAVMPIDDALLETNETVAFTIVPDPAYIAVGSRVATVIIVSDELFPDLIASALSAPATGGAGQSITLTETTKNQGGGPAGASTTRYFLSTNTTFDAGDIQLASRAIPGLAAGASNTGSVVATIPAGTATALWYLLATADATGTVTEDNESNNTTSRSIQIGADLTVSVLSAPATAGAGQSILVTDTTANPGGGTAQASQTRYFLSANTSIDASDIPLGSRNVAALPPGAIDTGSATVVVPDNLAAGTWYIIARADATDTVPETSETNNTRVASIRVGPDLTVPALTAPATAGAGQSVIITDTTKNQGGGMAPASVTQFYLSSDVSLDAADLPLVTREVPALAPDASSIGTTTITLPMGLASTTWYLFAKADASNAVVETVETNNIVMRGIKIGPDLTMSTLSAPAAAGPGDSITASDSTNNTGGGTAEASVTQYFLSANSVLDAADVLLGGRSVPALPAGTGNPGSLILVIPEDTAAGTWYLIAKADAEARVSETVESNNTVVRSIAIGADLTVPAASAPAVAGAGQSVTITDTTKNQGGGTAGPSTTRYYLSADTTLDVADMLIGSRSVPALSAGASNSGSILATIPPGTATGNWQIIAAADAAQVVAETNETNNLYRRSIGIGADLTLSALTVPATGGAGQVLSIADTTRNQGGGSAGASGTQYFLSSSSTLDANAVLLGTREVPDLAPGASSTGSTAVTVPPGTSPGTWFILAKADGAGALVETSESNNVVSRTLKIGGDLSVSALTVPSAAAAGQSVTVTDTTTNLGGGSTEASQTQYFLSSDSTFQATDTLLGTRDVPALAAGASSTGSIQLTIPAGLSAGRWYLLAVADGARTVEESIETNNVTSRAISVGPDLIVTVLTAPVAATAGQRVTIGDTTKNQGVDNAPASVTQFFLSANATLDAADTPLGERGVAALAAGASSTASTEVVIPATTPAGRWYLIGSADGPNTLIETIETNNTSARYIDISTP